MSYGSRICPRTCFDVRSGEPKCSATASLKRSSAPTSAVDRASTTSGAGRVHRCQVARISSIASTRLSRIMPRPISWRMPLMKPATWSLDLRLP